MRTPPASLLIFMRAYGALFSQTPDALLSTIELSPATAHSRVQYSTMSKSDLNAVYAEQFKNHPEGHALYLKVSGLSMKPGSCGYFTESGPWITIVQVAEVDPATLASEGWKPPAKLMMTENKTGIEWPIKLSESVQERRSEAVSSLK